MATLGESGAGAIIVRVIGDEGRQFTFWRLDEGAVEVATADGCVLRYPQEDAFRYTRSLLTKLRKAAGDSDRLRSLWDEAEAFVAQVPDSKR